jgi:hypothetical protein
MPAFNVDFFKPALLGLQNPAETTFEGLLLQISEMNLVNRIRRGEDPAVVLALTAGNYEYLGEAARIRMEDFPSIINSTTGGRHDLDVGNNEGLGEEIYFLYDAGMDVLAVQIKAHFRPGALAQLIGDLTNAQLEFHPILREDAWERFQQMDLITKVNFTLARPRDFRGQAAPSVLGALRQIDEYNGVAAKIEVSVGRERNASLNRSTVRRLIGARNDLGESLEDLSITGTIRRAPGVDAPRRLDTVDFIGDRLTVQADVERRGRGRRLDADGCRLALRRAIREHEDYLRRYRG